MKGKAMLVFSVVVFGWFVCIRGNLYAQNLMLSGFSMGYMYYKIYPWVSDQFVCLSSAKHSSQPLLASYPIHLPP